MMIHHAFSENMASRSGAMVTGTDGNDFEHRERVASVYQVYFSDVVNNLQGGHQGGGPCLHVLVLWYIYFFYNFFTPMYVICHSTLPVHYIFLGFFFYSSGNSGQSHQLIVVGFRIKCFVPSSERSRILDPVVVSSGSGTNLNTISI